VALEHWCSSGFANTDLDLQLKPHSVHKLIVIRLIATTCVAATVRFAAELGYEVTMVKDATADLSDEKMHAAPGTYHQRRRGPPALRASAPRSSQCFLILRRGSRASLPHEFFLLFPSSTTMQQRTKSDLCKFAAREGFGRGVEI
jgi:Isochorismatase family